MENEFYIDLKSNTFNDTFQNTRSKFLTTLHEPLIFDDPDLYEVGLAEFAFSNSFSIYKGFKIRVGKTYLDSNNLTVKKKEKTSAVEITELTNEFAVVVTLNHAIDYFNSQLTSNIARFKGRFKLKNYKLQLKLYPGESVHFIPDIFAHLLGFEIVTLYGSPRIAYAPQYEPGGTRDIDLLMSCDAERAITFRSNGTIKSEEFYHIDVYTNLIQFTRIGSHKAPVLRTIPIQHKLYHGECIFITFSHIYYHPVAANFFSEIKIELRDDSGEVLAHDFGKTYVKLHFRKKHHA